MIKLPHFGSYSPNLWGWSADSSQIAPYSYGGVSFPSGLHRLAWPVFNALIAEGLGSGVLPKLHAGWCWGYEPRNVRGSSSLSFHAYGLALDFNAPDNGMHYGGAYNGTIKSGMTGLARKYGCEWGEDWSGRQDPMHVELHLAPSEIAPLLSSLGHSTSTSSGATTNGTTLRLGSTGKEVGVLQRRLNLVPAVHPQFGPATRDAVVMYQKRHKLTADGVVGPSTQKVLDAANILPGERYVGLGNSGADVGWLQRRLNLTPATHPVFGPTTQKTLAAWKSKRALGGGGSAGPVTWAALLG